MKRIKMLWKAENYLENVSLHGRDRSVCVKDGKMSGVGRACLQTVRKGFLGRLEKPPK